MTKPDTTVQSVFALAIVLGMTVVLVLIWLEESWPVATLLTTLAILTMSNTYAVGGLVKFQQAVMAKNSLESVTARLVRRQGRTKTGTRGSEQLH